MKEIMLTVIMSNYNQEKYIREAIESVLMQKVTFKYQLIITDDFSQRDNSVQIIKEYVEKYPEIIHPLYNKENGGYLKNILRAKEVTKTPYFCLLDADDYYIDDNFLQRAFDFLQKNNDYVIYYENVNYITPEGNKGKYIKYRRKQGNYSLNDYFLDIVPIVQTTGQFYRNVIFKNGIPKIMSEAVGTNSEQSFEGDYDRFVMHLKYGKAHFNNQICGVYRQLPSGIWVQLDSLKREIIQLQCWYDYNRYFDNQYSVYFVNKMYDKINIIKNIICKNIDFLEEIKITKTELSQFKNLYEYVLKNKDLIIFKQSRIKEYIDKLRKKMCLFSPIKIRFKI